MAEVSCEGRLRHECGLIRIKKKDYLRNEPGKKDILLGFWIRRSSVVTRYNEEMIDETR